MPPKEAAIPKSILQPKRESHLMSIRVPTELFERIQRLRARIEQINPDMTVNVSAACAEAIEVAVKKAEDEIEAMARQLKPAPAEAPQRPQEATYPPHALSSELQPDRQPDIQFA